MLYLIANDDEYVEQVFAYPYKMKQQNESFLSRFRKYSPTSPYEVVQHCRAGKSNRA